jgi:hypothetical protein
MQNLGHAIVRGDPWNPLILRVLRAPCFSWQLQMYRNIVFLYVYILLESYCIVHELTEPHAPSSNQGTKLCKS